MTPTNNPTLREQFEKETGFSPNNEKGFYRHDYVDWLQKKAIDYKSLYEELKEKVEKVEPCGWIFINPHHANNYFYLEKPENLEVQPVYASPVLKEEAKSLSNEVIKSFNLLYKSICSADPTNEESVIMSIRKKADNLRTLLGRENK